MGRGVADGRPGRVGSEIGKDLSAALPLELALLALALGETDAAAFGIVGVQDRRDEGMHRGAFGETRADAR